MSVVAVSNHPDPTCSAPTVYRAGLSEGVHQPDDVRVRGWRPGVPARVHLPDVAQVGHSLGAATHRVRPKVTLDQVRTLAYTILPPFHLQQKPLDH